MIEERFVIFKVMDNGGISTEAVCGRKGVEGPSIHAFVERGILLQQECLCGCPRPTGTYLIWDVANRPQDPRWN